MRLLVKRHEGGPVQYIKGGQWDIWPIALAAPRTTTGDEWCEIELIEISAGARCTEAAVRSRLADTIFSGCKSLDGCHTKTVTSAPNH